MTKPETAPIHLRWLVAERRWKQYDDRDKEWRTSGSRDRPVLQYFDHEKWCDVPTVTEITHL